MCEKEPLLWTPPLPSNGRKTSKCGGILKKKQSAALTLEARIMNFIVLNPQVIPHRTGPSCQVILGRRLPMSTYLLVCLLGSRSSRKKNLEICSTLISISVDMFVCWVVDPVEKKNSFNKKSLKFVLPLSVFPSICWVVDPVEKKDFLQKNKFLKVVLPFLSVFPSI